MGAPTVFRWDDTDAPVARGERESLIDILRACLVDGYGTKAPAGFTLEYINTAGTIAAFRNNPVTGTGFYLQVDSERDASANTHFVAGYETMTDEATGLGPFSTYDYYLTTSSTVGTTARPWVLVADDGFFYLFIWDGITTAPTKLTRCDVGMCFGDIVPNDPGDNYYCMVTGSSGIGVGLKISAASTAVVACTSSVASMPRGIDGIVDPQGYSVIRGGGPSPDGGSVGYAGSPYTVGDPILYTRPYCPDKLAYSVRGWIPGLYYPCHDDAFDQLAEVTVDTGKTMLSICYCELNNALSNFFISLDDWRA